MPRSSHPPDASTLLAHRDWVRALAGRLVADSSAIDDLEQEAWLAALRRPPVVRTSMRAWLGGVVRNLARQRHRADSRRARREASAVRRDSGTAAADVAEGRDWHRHVVAAVLELPPQLREVVLLRYFDAEATSAIAVRLGIPYETVRSRLKTALARLRRELASAAGAERSAHGGALPWLLGLLDRSPHVPGPLQASGGLLTVATTSQKTAALVAALIVLPLLSAGGAFVLGRSMAVGETPPAPGSHETSARDGAVPEGPAVTEAGERSRTRRGERVALSHREDVDAGDEVAELRAAIRDLELQLEAARSVSASAAGAVPARTAPVLGAGVDLHQLSDAELLERARKFTSNATAAECLPIWEHVLDRGPDDEVAVEAHFKSGIAHYWLQQHPAAAACFRAAIERGGLDVPRGRLAAYQLGLSLAAQGEHEAASAQMEALGTDERTISSLAAQALLHAGRSAREAGDTVRARAMYVAALDVIGDRGDGPAGALYRGWADEANRGITRIDAE